MQPAEESGLTEDFIMPVPSLTTTNSPAVVYASFTRDAPEEYQTASFQCTLKFVSKELDPSTGEPEEEGYEDEYQLEDTELSAADYIIPNYVTFAPEWDRMRGGVGITETFSLPGMESLKGKFRQSLSIRTGVPDDRDMCSRVRLYRRNPQHAAAGRERGAAVDDGAHAAVVGARRGRRGQGARALSDDLLEGTGCDTRVRGAVGEPGSGEPDCCSDCVGVEMVCWRAGAMRSFLQVTLVR